MPMIVYNCPRCGADKITFDIEASNYIGHGHVDWLHQFEVFSICRACGRSTTLLLELSQFSERSRVRDAEFWSNNAEALNGVFRIHGYVSKKDQNRRPPPEHIPPEIETLFNEGASCLAIDCYNAAGTMFRLCLDVATRGLLPPEGGEAEGGPNRRQRRDLGLRLPWLIDNQLLPDGLVELAKSVREDGNDGAHAGNLTKEDAEDLLEFTEVLFDRLYTEPAKLALAEARRIERRKPANLGK